MDVENEMMGYQLPQDDLSYAKKHVKDNRLTRENILEPLCRQISDRFESLNENFQEVLVYVLRAIRKPGRTSNEWRPEAIKELLLRLRRISKHAQTFESWLRHYDQELDAIDELEQEDDEYREWTYERENL